VVESIWRKGKLFGFMLLAGILLMAKPALADSYYPYEIQGYDVTVKVGKDNVYHVTERLQGKFYVHLSPYCNRKKCDTYARQQASYSYLPAEYGNKNPLGLRSFFTIGFDIRYARLNTGKLIHPRDLRY